MFLRDFFEIKPPRAWWGDTLRLAAPVPMAFFASYALGPFPLGMMMALGAYVSLFGAGQPARQRLLTLLMASAYLLLAIALGAMLGQSFWLLFFVYPIVAIVVVAGAVALDPGPPGPYFFVVMVGGGTLLARLPLPLPTILGAVALGSLLAIAFAMADLVVEPHRPEREAVEAAAAAVAKLEAQPPGAVNDTLEQAVDAIQTAWGKVLSGIREPHGGAADRLTRQLLAVHRRYRELYLEIVGRDLAAPPLGGKGGNGDEAERSLARTVPATLDDARTLAFGPPSAGYRLRAAFGGPSLTMITLVRIIVALLAVNLIGHGFTDRHPFWPVLVVVFVLSYPGDQRVLWLRALQRLGGTIVGILLFALMLASVKNDVLYIAVLWGIFLFMSLIVPRNYFFGTIAITVFALMVNAALSATETPAEMAAGRILDTLIAVVVADAALWLIGPSRIGAIALYSARLVADAAGIVLDFVARREAFRDPAFVEQRRRLRAALRETGVARKIARPGDIDRQGGFFDFERACASLGYAAQWVAFHPLLTDAAQVERMRAALHGAMAARPAQASEAARLAADIRSALGSTPAQTPLPENPPSP